MTKGGKTKTDTFDNHGDMPRTLQGADKTQVEKILKPIVSSSLFKSLPFKTKM